MQHSLDGYFTEKVFHYPVRVYFSDTDAGSVVYHAKYLDFIEHARSELIRKLGGNQQRMIEEERNVFVIRSINAEYIQPARLDDLLDIETEVVKCGKLTLFFRQQVKREGILLGTFLVKAGFFSLEKGKPIPMSPKWYNLIKPLVVAP